MSEPVWVRDDVVLAIHRRQLAEHGGQDGLRDLGLLQSALNKPKNLFHYADPTPQLSAMAARYAYGLTLNHPFIDGNKRTAFVVCQLFLNLNNVKLQASSFEKYEMFMQLASGAVSEETLGQWIAEHLID
ncbi:MAG: type II toxin-antitoxin system death-on-curing family toxin [Robiginitomaculum sp.]|nr:type II toxin-antitoxin system death-on-curing family toxin [Robiginitomaculum sp.]